MKAYFLIWGSGIFFLLLLLLALVDLGLGRLLEFLFLCIRFVKEVKILVGELFMGDA